MSNELTLVTMMAYVVDYKTSFEARFNLCFRSYYMPTSQLQMLLFPNALCCSLYERNCVCAVTKIFTKFLPANNFCQLLRVTRKRSCTSASNAQAQLHFRDDQQRAFGISNISNCVALLHCTLPHRNYDVTALALRYRM